MDNLDIVQFVQRAIKDRKSMLLDVMESNSVRDMEHYQYLMGSLEMLNYIAQALSDLLEKQELMDD
jgi:hypothetical protein|tara:strand:- start:1406 stop:1603 length:198 start_codon:yes stop_codon:yes gene_type:complete